MTGFISTDWTTTLSTAIYTKVLTDDWQVYFWVGTDDAAWSSWE